MAAEIDRDSTEYVFFGVTGTPPSVGAEAAFKAAGVRPESGDWSDAVVIEDNLHVLWDNAVASGVTGDYFVAILVGAFGGNTLTLTAGDYQPWLRLTDTTEQPVKIAPVVLTVT